MVEILTKAEFEKHINAVGATPCTLLDVKTIDILNRMMRTIAYFDNKVYILERTPEDELSDRYRYEVNKLRRELEMYGYGKEKQNDPTT